MSLWRQLRDGIRVLVRRDTADRALDAEFDDYRARMEAMHVAAGMTTEAARRAARIASGPAVTTREAVREGGWEHHAETVLADLRFAGRQARKQPGFTAVCLATLALGIGATTAIFSVLYGVLLRPLPYRDASRLVVLHETTPRVGTVSVSIPDFLDWRRQSRTLPDMSGFVALTFNLGHVGVSRNITAAAVSSAFLGVLGVRPLLGRDFLASEDAAGTARVVLVSYGLWQSQLGGTADVLGRSLLLDGRPATVVGVLPRDFRAPVPSDVLEPLGALLGEDSTLMERGNRGDLVVVGRLAGGATLADARSEMRTIGARLASAYPESNDQFGVDVAPMRDAFVGDLRTPIVVLFGAVVCVLLIACVNVANLFLARAATRRREIALRTACGASRGRIVRQLLTESLGLAGAGGAAGLGVAIMIVAGLRRLMRTDADALQRVHLDGVVLLFAAALVMTVAMAFGLVPALVAARGRTHEDLKSASRGSSAARAQGQFRDVLAGAEIALALVLLVGAGLMVRTLDRLAQVDPGFRPEGVLTAELQLAGPAYQTDAAERALWERLLAEVRAFPGVEAAALGTNVPLTESHERSDVTFEGMALPRVGAWPHPDLHKVSPDYFRTLGTPVLRGRDFTEADDSATPRVAIINDVVARQYFPDRDPVGTRMILGYPSDEAQWITIVGVVASTHMYGLANPSRLEVYLDDRQYIASDMDLLIKSRLDQTGLTAAIRRTTRSLDPDLPLSNVATMPQLVRDSTSTQRVVLILLAAFSAVAVLLAAIGVYGVMSYTASQRRQEIGIRMALGAQRGTVLRMIVGRGAAIAAVALAVGIGIALAVGRLMAGLLFNVSATDPVTFAAVTVLLGSVALGACYLPARRAVTVSPTVALRAE